MWKKPIYGESLLRLLTVNAHDFSDEPYNKYCLTLSGRMDKMNDTIEKYSIITPAAVAFRYERPTNSNIHQAKNFT